MNFKEIREKYDHQWVLVEYEELDENLEVKKGRVIAHSTDKGEVYKVLGKTLGKNVSLEYVGSVPPDLTVMFSASLRVASTLNVVSSKWLESLGKNPLLGRVGEFLAGRPDVENCATIEVGRKLYLELKQPKIEALLEPAATCRFTENVTDLVV